MAVPNIDDLFAPIITCLSDGKIHSLKELTEYCAVALNLSKNDIEQRLDDGRTKLYFRVGWAKQHLKKAGLIDSPQRAYFRLTTEGFNAFKSGTEKINKKYLSQFDGYYYDKSTATNDNSDMINITAQKPLHDVVLLDQSRQCDCRVDELIFFGRDTKTDGIRSLTIQYRCVIMSLGI